MTSVVCQQPRQMRMLAAEYQSRWAVTLIAASPAQNLAPMCETFASPMMSPPIALFLIRPWIPPLPAVTWPCRWRVLHAC